MTAFFAKRPGTCLLTLLTVFVAGGVFAGQGHAPALRPLLTASRGPGRERAARPQPKDWRASLDLSRAQPHAGRLVQRVGDGTEVTYTVDADLQQWATSLLQSYEVPYGAIVLYEIDKGKVLTLAGYSAQNPKMGADELCLNAWAPAASIFKLVTASALLESGVPAETRVCYHGGLHGIGKQHLVDSPRLDSACGSLGYAVARSINPIMGKLALRYLNRQSLRRWSSVLGFDQPVPFELAVQPSRVEIPTEPLEFARVAAGFWHTQLTALHGAVLAGVAAKGGVLAWPHVVESARHADGRVETLSVPAPQRVISQSSAQRLAQMMVDTTVNGTARKAFRGRHGKSLLGEIVVGGKTGSLTRANPFLHYNWFVGFAPANRPRIAFAVLLGNPPAWRVKASTVGRMLLEHYFNTTHAEAAPSPPQHARKSVKPVRLASRHRRHALTSRR